MTTIAPELRQHASAQQKDAPVDGQVDEGVNRSPDTHEGDEFMAHATAPVVAWAHDVQVDAQAKEGSYRAEATLLVLDEEDLPAIGIEQLLDYVDGQWIADGEPAIFMSGISDYTILGHPDDARALAAALSQAADALAGIQKAGEDK